MLSRVFFLIRWVLKTSVNYINLRECLSNGTVEILVIEFFIRLDEFFVMYNIYCLASFINKKSTVILCVFFVVSKFKI